MKKKILVIAPHPDDEVLGCGAIIKKYSEEGNSVYVLIVTRGTPRLYAEDKILGIRAQAIEAHSILGVKETFFFDYPAPELDLVSQAVISESIATLIAKLKIEILFIPHRGDIHRDHYVVFNAALVSARPVGNYTVKEVYSYETLSETEWAAPISSDVFIPDHFINIEKQMPFKLKAIKCFTRQVKVFPNPRSLEGIEALAKYRGSTVGFNLAEAFMTIRTIIE